MGWREKIDTILKDREISRRELARMAGINEQTLGTVFRTHPKHLAYKYGQPIAEALHINVNDLYMDDPAPGVVIGPADQELQIPSIKKLTDDDYKLQQIIEAYTKYKDPLHRDELHRLAMQQLMDEF